MGIGPATGGGFRKFARKPLPLGKQAKARVFSYHERSIDASDFAFPHAGLPLLFVSDSKGGGLALARAGERARDGERAREEGEVPGGGECAREGNSWW